MIFRGVTLMETIHEAPGGVISGRLRAYVEPDYAIETIQQVLITYPGL